MTSTPPHLLLTGASSGIGYAIAERALSDGWRVTGVSRRGNGPKHSSLRGIPVDLTDRAATLAAARSLDGITAFVHAAGFMTTAPIETSDSTAGNEMWRIHVGAAVDIASVLAPNLSAGGRIVLIGSRVASGVAGRGQYAAVKAAQIALARSWAAELVTRQITVNVVAPGATDTPMLTAGSRASSTPRTPPIGRLIRPGEVAAAVAFLLSPAAAPITGQTLTLCGGASL